MGGVSVTNDRNDKIAKIIALIIAILSIIAGAYLSGLNLSLLTH